MKKREPDIVWAVVYLGEECAEFPDIVRTFRSESEAVDFRLSLQASQKYQGGSTVVRPFNSDDPRLDSPGSGHQGI